MIHINDDQPSYDTPLGFDIAVVDNLGGHSGSGFDSEYPVVFATTNQSRD
jgi:hypothetical protein